MPLQGFEVEDLSVYINFALKKEIILSHLECFQAWKKE